MNAADPAQHPRSKFVYMLVGLAVLLLAGPLLRTLASLWSPMIFWVTVGVAIAAGGWSVFTGRTGRIAGCIFGVAITLGGALASTVASPALYAATCAGFMLFCLLAIASSLKQTVMGPVVDLNRIAGAVCVYVLMGLVWAVMYSLLALLAPDAFKGLPVGGFDEQWSELLYFSFVTLTTLGYGDISPVAHLARTLAYLEAMIGQLYIAILIAGLVGAHLSERGRSHGA